jgi:REP element-mobilizing transposase RayT
MSQSLSKILLHAIFSTKNRTKLILPEFENELHGYIGSICRNNKSNAYKVGGTENHIHIACTLPRTITVAKLMEEIKKSSSKWIKGKSPRCSMFAWQAGYSVFSLGQSQLDILIRYIQNQKQHHKRKTYKEEVLELLEKYDVQYDEKYLWD